MINSHVSYYPRYKCWLWSVYVVQSKMNTISWIQMLLSYTVTSMIQVLTTSSFNAEALAFMESPDLSSQFPKNLLDQ